MGNYLQLTKPRISLLFAVTGVAVALSHGISNVSYLLLISAAIFCVGGAANGLNQYFEREVDSRMARTAKKRPLPQGAITPNKALIFIFLIALFGLGSLYYLGGLPPLAWGVATIIFYSFYYTLWLKPRTPYNIVIGGAAGAAGPLIASAAVHGSVTLDAFVMFLLIFMWTPPHFWALALCCKDDYREAGYPMLPLVKGDHHTKVQIVLYSLTLLPISVWLYFSGGYGLLYLISSMVLGVLFIWGALRVYRSEATKTYWQFFGYSIIYLMLLFLSIIVDSIL